MIAVNDVGRADRYRIIYVMPDHSRRPEASGLATIGQARQVAGVLMPPVGHLRPDWVEVLDRQQNMVDEGPVTDLGGIAWASQQPNVDPGPLQNHPEATVNANDYSRPLALFDREAA